MSSAQHKRVLVIDDHPGAAELLALVIDVSCERVTVAFATDGLSGLSMALESHPHLVITDIDMPLLSGIEAALDMRSALSSRPLEIVAMTGDCSWSDDAMATAVFDEILIKPIDVQALVELVQAPWPP